MITYYSLNDYCREHFGKKLYKLALDAGTTCPNRDGTLGSRGCIFCSASGSGEFAEHGGTVTEQIERAKKRVESKNKNGGYIAYFQSFTSTYAPEEYLRKIFTEAVNNPDIDALSVATRPDCLPEGVISLLSELNKIKPVWTELGLQTSRVESVRYIRRGYENAVYSDAVQRLHAAGIYVITHVILGLPGETVSDMRETVEYAVKCGTDGIKLQLLHVLRDSDLYEPYMRGEFEAMSLEKYISVLVELLAVIPQQVAVHRLTGDGAKRNLVAPMWSADKKHVINEINRYLKNSTIPENPACK